MKTSHRTVLLAATMQVALAGLAAFDSATSILQGVPERVLLVGIHPAAALANLAMMVPAPTGSLRTMAIRVTPALTGIAASLVYLAVAQGAQRIHPEVLLILAAIPLAGAIYVVMRTRTRRREQCPQRSS